MADKIGRKIGSFFFAVLVHLGFVAMLIFSFNWNSTPEPQQSNVVNAVLINEKPAKAPAKKPSELKSKPEVEQPPPQESAQKKLEEQRRTEKVVQQKKREAEQLRAAQLKKDQAQKQHEEQLRIEEQKLVEQKRLAEEQTKRKMEEQARKKREEDERRRREDEEELKRTMSEEEGARNQMSDRQKASLTQQWVDLVRDKVSRKWIKPDSAKPGMECKVRVQQIPGGTVINVTISCNHSDTSFQRSIIAAVNLASPLPLPSDPSIFDREIEFIFKPK